MGLGNGAHLMCVCHKWIDIEEQPPEIIGQRVLVYPIDGEIEVAEYIGEGLYKWYDYTISGETLTHWSELPDKPQG